LDEKEVSAPSISEKNTKMRLIYPFFIPEIQSLPRKV